MGLRAYMPLDIADGKPEQVVRVLRDRPRVVMAGLLERPPDMIVIIKACEHRKVPVK
jgi:hypothetical protein